MGKGDEFRETLVIFRDNQLRIAKDETAGVGIRIGSSEAKIRVSVLNDVLKIYDRYFPPSD